MARETPADASPPKTGPNSAAAQAYPLTHKKMIPMRAATVAKPPKIKNAVVKPVFSFSHSIALRCRTMSIRTSPLTKAANNYSRQEQRLRRFVPFRT